MSTQMLNLKKLNAAYIAALEFDRCPDEDETINVNSMFDTGVTEEQLKEALTEHQGRRPDEIASEMSDLIKTL